MIYVLVKKEPLSGTQIEVFDCCILWVCGRENGCDNVFESFGPFWFRGVVFDADDLVQFATEAPFDFNRSYGVEYDEPFFVSKFVTYFFDLFDVID